MPEDLNSLSRGEFMQLAGGALAGLGLAEGAVRSAAAVEKGRSHMTRRQPNILFVMTDQQRADTIAALGNPSIYTPNYDRLVRRGVSFVNGYSTCPVCVAARYTIRTGCEPPTTGIYGNMAPDLVEGQQAGMEDRCGPYLARQLGQLGYRTFGVGKFHTHPWDENVGFEVHLHTEELYGNEDQRMRDAYAGFIAREHPEYDFIEMLHGERTEMYYMPQVSPLPASLTVENFVADRVIEQIRRSDDERPYFGFVSFIGPHPPFAPPLPFNRMYDPDRMENPVRGVPEVDLMDEQIRWMNHAIWADDINDSHARVLKARYYGEISYIDYCLGRILDAVEARGDAENTLICLFADHGDHLGDHGAWQKESYFDAAARVPYLVSWPDRLPADVRREEIVCLTDLFAIATRAAGKKEMREGFDVLHLLEGKGKARRHLIGYYGTPGTNLFKVMVREAEADGEAWKYIYMANGGCEQLFDLKNDPRELKQRLQERPEVVQRLRRVAIDACSGQNVNRALNERGDLRGFPASDRPKQRIYQFAPSRGVRGFPEKPEDVLRGFRLG